MFKPLKELPRVSRDPSDILLLFGPQSEPFQRVVQRALKTTKKVLGCDLEYREPEKYKEEPTVLGLSDGYLTVSVPFEEGLPFFQELRSLHPEGIMFVGHAFTSADKFAFRNVGVEIELEDIEDTIIRFFLCNSHLCKTGNKVEDGDGEKRGKGYMNLWTFLSLYTDLPNYKELFVEKIPFQGREPIDVWEYNGLDSYGPLPALPSLLTQAKLKGVDKLYELHRELAYVLGEMSRYGVQIDRDYLYGEKGLQKEFEVNKEGIEKALPFNPRSNKEALSYFKEKGVELKDWQEKTIREAIEKGEEDEELALCLDYKELGNGTERWFAPVSRDKSGNWVGYMDGQGKIHPRLGMFTSTGRLQCTSPNLQNVAKRRVDRHVCECGGKREYHPQIGHDFKGASLGKMVRRAIIASPGYYLLKADYSNAENRVFLFLGGHHIPNEIDLHLRVSDIAQLTPEMEFSISMGGPREAAKSIQHAGNYLEGLQLKSFKELQTPRVKSEIAKGARLVFPEWTFNGKIVNFTGANLAQRAFGDKSFENRRKALEVATRYFEGFPGARELQKRIMKQAEGKKAVITPHGYYLLCVAPETKILKSDLTWVDAGTLLSGDKLVGFDENISNKKGSGKGKGVRRKLKVSIVEKVQRKKLPAYRIITTKGTVIASEGHLWLTKVKKSANNLGWIKTENLRPGQKISFLSSPWKTDSSREAGYLAGVFDGEGSIGKQGKVSFSQNPGIVLSKVKKLLKKRGFDVGEHSDKNGKQNKHLYFRGKGEPDLRFIGEIRPERLLQKAELLWEKRRINNSQSEKAEVVSVEFLGEREVIGLQTSTKTFIAEGLFSHNSFGDEEERCKTAAAMWGSNPVAHFTKLALVDLWRKFQKGRPMRPILQVHDEIICEVPLSVDPKEAAGWLRESMEIETPEIPGLILPIGNPSKGELASFGPNWRDTKAVKI